MFLSACIWALSAPEEIVLTKIADAGFTHIDIRPGWLASGTRQVRDLGLSVSCMAASAVMPEGADLTSVDSDAVGRARAHIEQALEHGASLGATAAYLVPAGDDRDRYTASVIELADRAQSLGLKLCIEHFPGTMLPTAAGTLAWLREIGHPNLYLLFDIGHAQMSNEDPAETLRQAGPQLGYVHLDDNDGVNDQHLALLDGVLTELVLTETFTALNAISYPGAVSLELHPELPDPLNALKQSREITCRIHKHMQST